MKHTVLLIEDNVQSIELFKPFLESEGYRVLIAQTGKEALLQLSKFKVNLAIVDLMLPDIFGSELCQLIRKKTTTPILVLSASEEQQDYIDSINMGADGIAEKSMDLGIIAAKIRAIIRREELKKGAIDVERSTTGKITFSGWELLAGEQKAIAPSGTALHLTTNEVKLMLLFTDNAYEILSRETIGELIGVSGEDEFFRSVDTIICRLRKKLQRITPDIELIKTIRNQGYQFVGQVDK